MCLILPPQIKSKKIEKLKYNESHENYGFFFHRCLDNMTCKQKIISGEFKYE